ncbi:hypothetical protein FT663_00442 [Candidozyma haemuli var. vulneris]|uniref:Amino acid transporter transmembrane domain-containing protein n=1 Tax=Candidozyma haemuli TaxID=45357 RepID=A0A2V1AUA4_9ASCO|nr:hypothetical protein CXQ85_002293 [[Candida] haemuloni]KAF3993419.1 hypothetical protein FT662_00548 [[Candida] haemuloni var. vulneris]KAF3995389.1 hypothetical protein FT663_00442 [[Candida] haemuloni var. vulneris]PVH20501.1 hypothetical protein CXQ85_002293 [[Candida] haemuloni]
MSDDEYTENSRLLHSRRTSLLDQPVGSFRGPNSLHNFASSFTRAQSFAANKIDANITKKRSFFAGPDDDASDIGVEDDELFDPDLMAPSSRGERLSTVLHEYNFLRGPNALGASGPSPYNEVFYQDDISNILHASRSRHGSVSHPSMVPISKQRSHPALSFSSHRSTKSWATSASYFGIKKVEDKDGNLVTVIAGQSTAPQTVMNSVNVLIGVGLLALPVGFLKGGWVLALPALLLCCAATCWTASLLSEAMDTDQTLMTYADLGYASYGSTAKLLISFIFSLDLLGSGVSLILLFSDSLYSLLGSETGGWSKTDFKILALFVLTPFTFMPLPILSIFSLFGIMSTFSIIILVGVCGFIKSASPGSLLQIMPTNLWPASVADIFLAIGIIMAPFGGHAIFPNLKSDMRHPQKFKKTLLTTYSITCVADCSMAVIGFLMFGKLCNNEVTSNLLETAGYPSWIYPLISGLICLIPLAKTPLNAKPIISTLDGVFNLDNVTEGESAFWALLRTVLRFCVRVGVNVAFVGFAILVPEFDRIVGILGSSICFLVCVILPCSFYLKLCKNNIRATERFFVRGVIIFSSILAITCTYFTIVH